MQGILPAPPIHIIEVDRDKVTKILGQGDRFNHAPRLDFVLRGTDYIKSLNLDKCDCAIA